MKKILSITLLICVIITPILTSYAIDSYDYTEYEVIVITPNLFESLFLTDRVDRVRYDYKLIAPSESESANVVLNVELLINGISYYVNFNGDVNACLLSDNDILYQGSIDGIVKINGVDYKVIAGITHLKSTDEKRVSLSIQNVDGGVVAVSFGDNVIKGKVLDFFNEQMGNVSADTDIVDKNPQTGNASISSISPDFSQKIDPEIGSGSGESGDRDNNYGYFDLGKNGEWKFQSKSVASHPKALYTALQSRVYFDDTRNILMVTLRPYTQSTEEYYLARGYTYSDAYLDSFGVTLQVNGDVAAANYAIIAGIVYPKDIIESYGGSLDNNSIYISAIFGDILDLLGVPSNLITSALDNAKGDVTENFGVYKTSVLIKKSLFSSKNFNDLDSIETGLPFKFQLILTNASTYVGNTEYTVTAYVKYAVSAAILTPGGEKISDNLYVEKNTYHSGKVTLGK